MFFADSKHIERNISHPQRKNDSIIIKMVLQKFYKTNCPRLFFNDYGVNEVNDVLKKGSSSFRMVNTETGFSRKKDAFMFVNVPTTKK